MQFLLSTFVWIVNFDFKKMNSRTSNEKRLNHLDHVARVIVQNELWHDCTQVVLLVPLVWQRLKISFLSDIYIKIARKIIILSLWLKCNFTVQGG